MEAAQNAETPHDMRRSPPHASLRWRLAPWMCGLLALFANFESRLIIVPLNRLVELTICRDHYANHNPDLIGPGGDVPELYCKEKPIQMKVAYLIGLITFLGLFIEIIVTVPLGYASDRYGRKVVLVLNNIAVLLALSWVMLVGYAYKTFPIGAIIVAPFFYLLKGNVNLATVNLHAIIVDVSKDPSQRTMIFSYFHAVGKVNLLLNPAIAWFTLSRNLWLPFWIGIGSITCVFGAISALPDTRSNANKQNRSPTGVNNGHPHGLGEQQPLLQDNLRSEVEESDAASQSVKLQVSVHEHIQRRVTQLRMEWRDFTHLFNISHNLSLIFSIFFRLSMSASVANILLQYISVRYHWTFAKSGYLFTMKAGVGLLLYTVFIPSGLYILTQWKKQSKTQANVEGAKISAVLVCLGALTIGLSAEVWMLIIALIIYSLGLGLSLFMLSLLASATFEALDGRHTARVFSIVGLLETLGELVGTTVLSGIWIGAVKLGGLGLGLPFFASAGFYLGVGVLV